MAIVYTDNLFADMTANDAPSPNVTSASGAEASQEAWEAFNRNIGQWWSVFATTGWLKYDFGSGNGKVCKKYTVVGYSDGATQAPKDWTWQGSNNDSDWTTLDTVTGETSWTSEEKRTFTTTSNNASYRYYKMDVTANNGDGSRLRVEELELMEELGGAVGASVGMGIMMI